MQYTAVITGGSKGIGLALTEKFLIEGFNVVCISRSQGETERLQEMHGDRLLCLFADLSVKSEIIKVGEEIKSRYKTIDVLVNNAGRFFPGSVSEEEDGVFEMQMALNVGSAYHLTRNLLPILKGRSSYIFNICSTASIVPYINGGSYCISKHALLGFSKVLREEMKTVGVRVSSVLPGATLTDSWSEVDLPESRFIRTTDIASAIWFAWLVRENTVMEEILLRPIEGDI
ncbi:MAG TPA: SDR family oxidoreductase [Bacteroidia bacterium]